MNRRLCEMFRKCLVRKAGLMLDAYNQKVYRTFAMTITTRINESNNHFVTVKDKRIKQLPAHYCNVGSRKNSNQGRTYQPDGLSPTISTMQGGNRQPAVVLPCAQRGRDGGQRLETKEEKTFNALTTVQKDSMLKMSNPTDISGEDFRVRKLTPRECFRLMGVEDSDIDKIQASGVSKSQQYKMAGNSIVVDVLYHIFRQAFTEDKDEQRQMTLF